MKEVKLFEIASDFDSYVEVLCKAILLDKVKIVEGKIKVESWE
jgi:hypothetical protein